MPVTMGGGRLGEPSASTCSAGIRVPSGMTRVAARIAPVSSARTSITSTSRPVMNRALTSPKRGAASGDTGGAVQPVSPSKPARMIGRIPIMPRIVSHAERRERRIDLPLDLAVEIGHQIARHVVPDLVPLIERDAFGHAAADRRFGGRGALGDALRVDDLQPHRDMAVVALGLLGLED